MFLSKNYSGDDKNKNITIEAPAGIITTKDHHSLVSYYGTGRMVEINKPSPTLTTKDRLAKVSFIANEYSAGGQVSSIESVSPAILTKTKQKLVSCDKFLVNPQYKNKGGSTILNMSSG